MKPTPPMLPGSFLVGHTFEFMKDRESVLQRGFASLGPIFAIKLGNRPTAVLIGPEYHQTFFLETDKKLSRHRRPDAIAAFGEVVTLAPPEAYEEQRPLLLRPFRSERMASYFGVMQTEVQQWLDSLDEQGEIELKSEIGALVQNIAAHALMGKAFRDELSHEFWKLNVHIAGSLTPILPPYLPLPRFIRRDRARKKIAAMLRPVITQRRAVPGMHDDFLQDIVNAHYKDGRPFEDETTVNMILGFMFAGYETTTSQTVWTIIQLLQNPEYLKTVQQEIADHFPYKQPLNAKIFSLLNHVSWAAEETARMRPSADMTVRRVEEDIEIGGYHIPKGWKLLVSASIAHRLPTLFAEPHKYDPLRFAPDRQEDHQHRFALIGFGGGIHKCSGIHFAMNEMKIITALLFQQFDLELVTKNPQAIHGMISVSQPERTVVRYFRKKNSVVSSSASSAMSGCPYSNSANLSSQQEQMEKGL